MQLLETKTRQITWKTNFCKVLCTTYGETSSLCYATALCARCSLLMLQTADQWIPFTIWQLLVNGDRYTSTLEELFPSMKQMKRLKWSYATVISHLTHVKAFKHSHSPGLKRHFQPNKAKVVDTNPHLCVYFQYRIFILSFFHQNITLFTYLHQLWNRETGQILFLHVKC